MVFDSGARKCFFRALVRLVWAALAPALAGQAAEPGVQGELLERAGVVDYAPAKKEWGDANVGQKLNVTDRLRTKELSRATVLMTELGRLRIGERTTFEILPPRPGGGKATLDLKAGAVYFFSREKPREFQLQMPNAIGAPLGTEWLAVVEPNGRSVLTVFDGEVEISNQFGQVSVGRLEQGIVEPGLAPVKAPAIQVENLVQWWLYYPGVLDINELDFQPNAQAVLQASLAAYQQGDLRQALASYPAGRVPQSAPEQIYYAGLLLSVGQVALAQAALVQAEATTPLAQALQEVIATVTRRPQSNSIAPTTVAGWLARSYTLQGEYRLAGALDAARKASQLSPQFGFAWGRVAELEFGFGRIQATRKALDEALKYSPKNAQVWALRGFIFAAENHLKEAVQAFEEAIRLDGALGNAWLGRGLCRIHQGDAIGGRRDLQTAAVLEPNRALPRSYLGKAFSNAGDFFHATNELTLATRLDRGDPTPWLYLALLKRQQNQINEAVDDLEHSLRLNDNRRVFRSRFLLDQDRAVRSASLATIYQQAGLEAVSIREASRAVTYDYGNYSAHLFLAESFNALRDPARFNLRYETLWFNELLLANLLAPASAGALSQHISQQEYSRLFEANRLGLSSGADYRSDGQWHQSSSQFGRLDNTSWAFDVEYQHHAGIRPNQQLERLEWYSQLKQQLSPNDTVMVLTKYQDYQSGDNFQSYDPTRYSPALKFAEDQMPIAVAGYHREWSPGVHTLLLGGRLISATRLTDAGRLFPILTRNAMGLATNTAAFGFNEDYRSQFEIFTGEFNQIIQRERQTAVFGTRMQAGEFRSRAALDSPVLTGAGFTANPAADLTAVEYFRRISAYGYYTIEPMEQLWLTGGLTYDRLDYPANFRLPPLSRGQAQAERFSPKAALLWNPRPQVTLRAMYARALGGASFDESFRLEPTQLAGFNQAFRTVISETVAGSVAAPRYETWGGAVDLKLTPRTFLSLQGEVLRSAVDRSIGVFDFDSTFATLPPVFGSATPERLRYEERSVSATLNRLAGKLWAFGAQYRLIDANLQRHYPDIRADFYPAALREQALLHQTSAFALINHPSGFFARIEGQWWHQANPGYAPARPTEDLPELNLQAGWRFRQSRGEVSLGVVNLLDRDYRLNPLVVYNELPRERALLARLRFNF